MTVHSLLYTEVKVMKTILALLLLVAASSFPPGIDAVFVSDVKIL